MKVSRFSRLILLALSTYIALWILIGLTSCGVIYTKKAAIRNFGCKQDSVKVDSFSTVVIDTMWKEVYLPGDSVIVHDPCKEIAGMNKGETKQKKGNRSKLVYGKDSTGRSFIKCQADAYRDSMMWYKEVWTKTVQKTIFQSNNIPDPSGWGKFQSKARDFMAILGLIF